MEKTYLFECRGRVRHGLRLGRLLGAPTANIVIDDVAEHLRGTFAAVVDGLARPYPAVAHVGVRPTVSNAGEPLVEAHLLDFDGDLYGREIVVRLEHKVSEEVRLDSFEALAGKIAADVAAVRAYFAERKGAAAATAGSRVGGPSGRAAAKCLRVRGAPRVVGREPGGSATGAGAPSA